MFLHPSFLLNLTRANLHKITNLQGDKPPAALEIPQDPGINAFIGNNDAERAHFIEQQHMIEQAIRRGHRHHGPMGIPQMLVPNPFQMRQFPPGPVPAGGRDMPMPYDEYGEGDYMMLIRAEEPGTMPLERQADLNGDGIVNTADLGMLIGVFGIEVTN